MANPEHVDILNQGVEVWNRWRQENSDIIPDLSKANFVNSDLEDVNFASANLIKADFSGSNLKSSAFSKSYLENSIFVRVDMYQAEIYQSSLVGINLMEANLKNIVVSHSNFGSAVLKDSDFRQSNINSTDFYLTDLSGADFTDADIIDVRFRHSNLQNVKYNNARLFETTFTHIDFNNADLSDAKISFCKFNDIDLSAACNLKLSIHNGPSSIGVDTIYLSQGNIPIDFFRGAGVSDNLLEYFATLNNKDFEYHSCFISYSSKDQDFADRLYADLQNKGVRCWFAPEDMKIGDKIRDRIDRSIRVHDKLLLILSEHSINSEWVEDEVESAYEQEKSRGTTVLFPIRLDDAVMDTEKAWAAKLRRSRHIGDFTNWKDHDSYQKAFDRLLNDLKAERIKERHVWQIQNTLRS